MHALRTASSRREETPAWLPTPTKVYQKVRHPRGSECYSHSKRVLLITAGWAAVAFLSFKAAHAELENKVYNPFEILEISTVCLAQCIHSLWLLIHAGSNGKGDQVAFQGTITIIVRVCFLVLSMDHINSSFPVIPIKSNQPSMRR